MSNIKKEQSQKMQATATRNILSCLLVVVIIGSAVGFYFGLQLIKDYAIEVSHTVTDSKASDQNTAGLGQLKQELASSQELVTKAQQLFSTPATYQAQATKDITKYAEEAGIAISSIDSSSPSSESGSPRAGANGGPTSGEGNAEFVTIKSPVSYMNLLKFLDAIEGNLPKMQVTNITLGRPAGSSGDMVTTDKITITVATR